MLIKPNQAGTVSARSCESEDVTIAHLAVGRNAGQFKISSVTRSERMAKWNEIPRIEEGPQAGAFAGSVVLAMRYAPRRGR